MRDALTALVWLVLISSPAWANVYLTWERPPSRVDGESLGDISYLIYWSDNDSGYKMLTDPVLETSVTMPETTPNGTECGYVKVSVFEEQTQLESDMSNSVKYCPGEYYVKGSAPPLPVQIQLVN